MRWPTRSISLSFDNEAARLLQDLCANDQDGWTEPCRHLLAVSKDCLVKSTQGPQRLRPPRIFEGKQLYHKSEAREP